MSDLAEFLLARITEDEAVARAATPGPWKWADDPEDGLDAGDESVIWASGMHTEGYVYVKREDADHIARHDPARVLAECAAKRLIVEAEPERWVLQRDAPGHTVDMGTPDGMVRVYGKLLTEGEYRDRYMELAPPSQTLLYLAMPYADHPAYREEWRQ